MALGLSAFLCSISAAPHSLPLELLKHEANEKLMIKKIAPAEYEWHLHDGASQTLILDFKKLGINPKDFDEIRFDLKPLVSQVGINAVIMGHPEPRQSSGWYLKFKAPTGLWSSGRFDLHLDDDGVFRRLNPDTTKDGQFHIRLYRRLLGYPGEPLWRKANIRNFRLVRRLVSVDFDILSAEINEGTGEISYTYPLRIKNNTDERHVVELELDSANTLKLFSATAPETKFELNAGEVKILPVRMFISTQKAMSLAPMYSEPLIPKVSIPGIEDSDVIPLMGYRRWPMWASVPLFNQKHWTPPTFQAQVAAKSKYFPSAASWQAQTIRRAEGAMKYDWPVPLDGPPGHDQGYRCRKCSRWLEPKTPISFNHHFCPTCKQEFVDNDFLNKAWIRRYHSRRASDLLALAKSWLLTGKDAYAEKAIDILMAYADAHPKLKIHGTRSTSGASRIGGSTLGSSYVIPSFAEAYWYLYRSPNLDEKRRNTIENMLRKMGRNVARHSVEYNNQQAEHFRAYGSAGLATRYWPLVAETIYGDFG